MSAFQKREGRASTRPGGRKPLGGVNCSAARHLELLYGRRDRPGRLPESWRNRLPDPASYYTAHVEKLTPPNAAGWASGRCPFHDDHNASLGVQLRDTRGGWRCHAQCGFGDLIAFHMRRTGLAFADAVRDLLGRRA
jgi:hypothetical protein